RGLTRAHDGRAVELIEYCRAAQHEPDIKALALIDRAVEALAVEPRLSVSAQRRVQFAAGGLVLAYRRRRHQPDAAQAIRDDLDRLIGRHVAERVLVHFVEAPAQSRDALMIERIVFARQRDFIALAGVAHVEAAFEP